MHIPRSSYLSVLDLTIHLRDWGPENAPAVICWHGLARTGDDFDPLAAHLADRYRVICPDTIGRGLSSWADDPQTQYNVAFYARQAVALLDALKLDRVRWVGTSMGGALGMILAGLVAPGRISHLVLNDIGPQLEPAAMARILAYVTAPLRFSSIPDLEAALRQLYGDFGALSDAQWRRMAETSSRRLEDGSFAPHYDPRAMAVFAEHSPTFDLWAAYDAISCPTLVLAGSRSDVLTPPILEKMRKRGPYPQAVTVEGAGHAPFLNTPDQIGALANFLDGAP